MITDDKALKYVRKLKEYCDERGEHCDTCIFLKTLSAYDDCPIRDLYNKDDERK